MAVKRRSEQVKVYDLLKVDYEQLEISLLFTIVTLPPTTEPGIYVLNRHF